LLRCTERDAVSEAAVEAWSVALHLMEDEEPQVRQKTLIH
jgi:hypothetical protein